MPERLPVPTFLICGFLGAGKTTLILDQLRSAGSETAVLVNEFGALGLDGAVVRRRAGVEVVEMPGGCICCSQKEGLIESVGRIARDIRPDRLLIEPSGVAEASEMIRALGDERLAGLIRLEAAITLVDASTFLEYSEPDAFGLFFRDQVVNADLIVVNKIDEVDEDDLAAIDIRVRELSPGTTVVKAVHGQLSTELPTGRDRQLQGGERRLLDFERLSLELPALLPQTRLDTLVCELSRGAYGRVVRAKGCFKVDGRGWVELQFAGGRVIITEGFEIAPARLTLIGFSLSEARMRHDLNLPLPFDLRDASKTRGDEA